MGFFDFIFGKEPSSNERWGLGDLKNLDEITVDDMKKNPIWINDGSGESIDGFDEVSERPVLGTTDVDSDILSQFISISILVEFPNENEFGSANIQDDGSISWVAVWREGAWVGGSEGFEGKADIEIQAIPSIQGEANILFVYDPKSDRGKRK